MLYIVLKYSQISSSDAICCPVVDNPSKQYKHHWKQWSHGKKTDTPTHPPQSGVQGRQGDAIYIFIPSGDKRAGPGKPCLWPRDWNSSTENKRVDSCSGNERKCDEAEVFTKLCIYNTYASLENEKKDVRACSIFTT